MISNITEWLQDIGDYALIGGALLILLSFPAKDKRFKTGYKGNAQPDFGLGKIGLVLIGTGFSCYGLKKFIIWNSTVAGIASLGTIILVLFTIKYSQKKKSQVSSTTPKEISETFQVKPVNTNVDDISTLQIALSQAIETATPSENLDGGPEGKDGFDPENFLAVETPELLKALSKERISYMTWGGKIFPDGKDLPKARVVLAKLGMQTKAKKTQ